jgi:hypothetical protein
VGKKVKLTEIVHVRFVASNVAANYLIQGRQNASKSTEGTRNSMCPLWTYKTGNTAFHSEIIRDKAHGTEKAQKEEFDTNTKTYFTVFDQRLLLQQEQYVASTNTKV